MNDAIVFYCKYNKKTFIQAHIFFVMFKNVQHTNLIIWHEYKKLSFAMQFKQFLVVSYYYFFHFVTNCPLNFKPN